jgi:hypothetical protein
MRGFDSSNSEDNASKVWSEDSWKTIGMLNGEERTGVIGVIGGGQKGLVIYVQARCARCQVLNVDHDTAEKDKNEPWDVTDG